ATDEGELRSFDLEALGAGRVASVSVVVAAPGQAAASTRDASALPLGATELVVGVQSTVLPADGALPERWELRYRIEVRSDEVAVLVPGQGWHRWVSPGNPWFREPVAPLDRLEVSSTPCRT
ncbi:hypothetical protein B7486_67045, partial [cyanobacterium TDX16]